MSAAFEFPEPFYVDVGAVQLGVYRMGPDPATTTKPTLLFIHGFPELAFSWRHLMQAFAADGYPVIAPDMRGYGASDAPEGVEAYRIEALVGDLVGLVDALNLDRVVAVGHDWGALVLWSLPFWAPGRFLGYAGLNVAHTQHYPMDPIELFRSRLGESMYIVQFQTEGRGEQVLEADVEATMRCFLRKPRGDRKAKAADDSQAFASANLDLLSVIQAGPKAWGGEPVLDDAALGYYVETFSRKGFTAPLHWYRNMTHNWHSQKQFLVDGKLPPIVEPVLMITADMDKACPAWLADGMTDLCHDLTRHDLQGCGHWSMQEQPAAVLQAIADWLKGRFVEA